MSTKRIRKNGRPDKPYPEFPLTASGNGQWCRKIRGKIHYFGHWDGWQAALDNHNKAYPYLKAGVAPPDSFDGLTIAQLCRVESGCFSPKSSERSTSTYAIRWLDQANTKNIGSKKEPAEQRFKKGTSNGSKKSPDNRFKKGTSKEMKNTNDISKQQVAADIPSLVTSLTMLGFDLATAQDISNRFPPEQINNQINWLAERKPNQNELGMLRSAIEQNWAEPVHLKKKRQSREKHRIQESRLAIDEQGIRQKKQARRQRRERLKQAWNSLNSKEQLSLKQAAIVNEVSLVKQEILLRKEIENPPTEFLDALAAERGLPRVTLTSPQT